MEQCKQHIFQDLGTQAVRNLKMLHQPTKRTMKLTNIIIDQKVSHLN